MCANSVNWSLPYFPVNIFFFLQKINVFAKEMFFFLNSMSAIYILVDLFSKYFNKTINWVYVLKKQEKQQQMLNKKKYIWWICYKQNMAAAESNRSCSIK